MKSNSFLPLYVTNFFGTLNDNFLKTLASFTVIGWLSDERVKSLAMGVTAGALVLPYILCSPLADRLTAVLEKRRIVRFAKWAELPIMAVAIAGFAMKSPWLVIGAVLLMGLQSSLYSPAKYALVRDIGGEARISTGMGGMEGVSFLGVLMGTVVGAVVADRAGMETKYLLLVGFAALGLIASYTIRAKEELNRSLHAINPVRYIRRAYRMAGRYAGLNAVIFTLSVFWWGAAMLQMGLLVYGKSETGLDLDATQTGMLLCGAAVGIVAGQIVAGFVDRRHFLLGATLLTGWIAAALLAVLYFVPLSPMWFGVVLGLLALDLGFFKLPLDAEIQKGVKGPKLNTMLSYFNQVSFLFMLAASGCYALVSWAFGPKAFLLLLTIVFLVAPFLFVFSYRSVMLYVGRWVFAWRYRIEIEGMEEAVEHKMKIPHISFYSLCVETETPLGQAINGGSIEYDFDFADSLWLTGRDFLISNGYVQYEISNFCKPGFECIQNMTYWSHENYIGCGSGATGTVYNIPLYGNLIEKKGEGVRYTNNKNVDEYIKFWNKEFKDNSQNAVNIPQSVEKIIHSTSKFEYFMMGLRTKKGINVNEYEHIFGEKIPDDLLKKLEMHCTQTEAGHFYMNEQQILFLNKFLEEIL